MWRSYSPGLTTQRYWRSIHHRRDDAYIGPLEFPNPPAAVSPALGRYDVFALGRIPGIFSGPLTLEHYTRRPFAEIDSRAASQTGWRNLGVPERSFDGTRKRFRLEGKPGAISYYDRSGKLCMLAFVRDSDRVLHIYRDCEPSRGWLSYDFYGGPFAPFESDPSVVAFVDWFGARRIWAFSARSSPGGFGPGLVIFYSRFELNFQRPHTEGLWRARGAEVYQDGPPSAITIADDTGTQHIIVFSVASELVFGRPTLFGRRYSLARGNDPADLPPNPEVYFLGTMGVPGWPARLQRAAPGVIAHREGSIILLSIFVLDESGVWMCSGRLSDVTDRRGSNTIPRGLLPNGWSWHSLPPAPSQYRLLRISGIACRREQPISSEDTGLRISIFCNAVRQTSSGLVPTTLLLSTTRRGSTFGSGIDGTWTDLSSLPCVHIPVYRISRT